ncbi:hypothetical protein RND81_07G035600 [Saponaria officinalis]|uniref:Secreted protein n=1 Tax=Saponaria officinalis TaxID=3572 RepID=A0AAW1JMR2_SAPOF
MSSNSFVVLSVFFLPTFHFSLPQNEHQTRSPPPSLSRPTTVNHHHRHRHRHHLLRCGVLLRRLLPISPLLSPSPLLRCCSGRFTLSGIRIFFSSSDLGFNHRLGSVPLPSSARSLSPPVFVNVFPAAFLASPSRFA